MKNKEKDIDECFICRAQSGRVFTPREEEILEKIRMVKQEFRVLEKRLEELRMSGSGEDEIVRVREKLDALRKERQNLERERIEAARERMRLLGHE